MQMQKVHLRQKFKQSKKERQQTEWEDRESRRAPDHDEGRYPCAKREQGMFIARITEHDELDICLHNW